MLAEGATAVDAMVAASAAIAVVYPHMNSLGGDGFWLIQAAGGEPAGIDACGFAAQAATIDFYRNLGHTSVPSRGPEAALCQAGTLDGWRLAREWSEENSFSVRPLPDLVAPAADLARSGITVTQSLQDASEKLAAEGCDFPSYLAIFQPDGKTLSAGETLRNPRLAAFLRDLGERGTEDFYRGEIGAAIASYLSDVGSPLQDQDFLDYQAQRVTPLTTRIEGAALFNLPPPTQGIASLLILALYDRIRQRLTPNTEAARVHCIVEATKLAFIIRDREVGDPGNLSAEFSALLDPDALDALAGQVSADVAMPWPHVAEPGDTVWMGALDQYGTMVSFIQSIYWEFGSSVVVPEFGLVWNNRGLSFQLDAGHRNALAPRRRPFHTLNPAFALLEDGRRLAYGTMGGEGQPQTQAATFTRFFHQQDSLTDAIAKPRWLLGRTWGSVDNDLKLEQSLNADIGEELAARGHVIAEVPDLSESLGHAGAICLSPSGDVEAATDPRSDGAAFTAATALEA
ncbi:MAG: gamma-glutamyltransferase [Pseudomonadota bacterium]